MNVKRLWWGVVAVCIGVAGAAGVDAQIRVGSVVDSRGGSGWTLDGSNMTAARAKLLATANFGVSGTVNKPVVITDTAAGSGSINAALLANFDVFFIGYFPTATFTAGELTALQTWVNGGGALVATCDDASHADVCSAFGHTPTTSATSPVVPTALGATGPVFAGPFGAAPSITMQFTEGYFPTVGSASIIGQDSAVAPHATVLQQTLGSGRALFLSDVDMISDFSLSAGAAITNNNDRFFGNLFAFAGSGAAPPAPVLPVPIDPRLLVLIAVLLAALGWRRLRQR